MWQTIPKCITKRMCFNIVQKQNYATRKRFYRTADIIQNNSKWEIRLDQKKLKTPNGKPLLINSEPLARAIAAEWDAQNEVISLPTMHLTALCNTSLDNPGKLTVHDVANYLLEYYATDTLLFYTDEDNELRSMQEEKWGAILEWFQKRFDVKQEVSYGLELPVIYADTRAALAKHFLSYDLASLNAVCFGAEALKSPLLMLATMERRLDPRDAVALARLEEEYQLRHWGRVPWAHELSQAELTARLAAAVLVIHCRNEHHSAKTKTVQQQ